ncbi:MAG TPA: PQQ-dependent sugar dehydrogenase [Roseiflexaceae bacterium]|nr:PQQ-dependent sugar dehydrogenase [Roseiflexaceae bacterium]
MRYVSLCVIFCMTALLLASCGSGSSASSTPTNAPPVISAPTPQPTAAPKATSSAPAATNNITPGEIAPPATAAPAAVKSLKLQPVVTGLRAPVYATHAGDGSGRMFVVEKQGRIMIVRDGAVDQTPFLDISDRVGSRGSEQGLLSVAFHPNYKENGRLFVDYTDTDGNTVISRFQAQGDRADPSSETALLHIDQPYANHNGGLVTFGPDGYLYIGMGDGGSGGDPQGNGQNTSALLGKLLRINVDQGEPYGIPSDNPWANGQGGRPEVWAYGLRNPWRYSFDRATGDLYIADVGQNAYEEVDMQPANSGGGKNYGWNVMEGTHCYNAKACDTSNFVMPINDYSHDLGCSVTGGYVYRGADFPQLVGTYVFGDYCSGRVWTLRQVNGEWQRNEMLDTDMQISSFGEDEAGELYLTDLAGGLYRVVVK